MQVLVTGFLVSLFLWAVIAFASLKIALKLFESGGLAEKWLLLVPFLFTYLVFFGIRYRFSLWFLERQAAHELFSIGAYGKADLIVFVVCIPLFYAISILRPAWVVQVRINLPLLVLLPFALKLALYFSGLAGWELDPAKMMPTRLE
ncbi:MAG: hypothetical protein ACXVB9_09265 [Bdellovibrionota bacterium]